MSHALIDNDVLYKITVYGALAYFVKVEPFGATQFSMLGAAKFMISKKVKKKPPSRGHEITLNEFNQVLKDISVIEPTDAEIRLAAELEHSATQLNLELDGGESLLCAILILRAADYIFTGDKRAVTAISTLTTECNQLLLAGKIVCLEQIFQWLIHNGDGKWIRSLVCSELKTDMALTNCFACYSESEDLNTWNEGLNSYINNLTELAPNALAKFG